MMTAVDSQLALDLTEDEQTTLNECESVIEKGREAFKAVGLALKTIRDARLYRATHVTFEAYLHERWDLGKSSGYRFIDAYDIVAGLSPIGDVLPANEAQVRPLAQLEPADRNEAWKEVVETAPKGKVTAAHVQAVVDKKLPGPSEAANDAALGDFFEEKGQTQDAADPEPVTVTVPAPAPTATPKAAAAAPKPAETSITPPPPASPSFVVGAFVSGLIPKADHDWLLEQGLTIATALAELRERRDELAAAYEALLRPQLTPISERAISVLCDDYNARHPDKETSPALLLESMLVTRCRDKDLAIPEETKSDDAS